MITIKILAETRRLAKILAAHTGETLYGLIDRLIREEVARKHIDILS